MRAPLLLLPSCLLLTACPQPAAQPGEGSSSSGATASSSSSGDVSSSSGGSASSAGACTPCSVPADCGTAANCVHLNNGNFCLPSCDNAPCTGGAVCTTFNDATGNPETACLGDNDPCGSCQPKCPGNTTCEPQRGVCLAQVASSSSGGIASSAAAPSSSSAQVSSGGGAGLDLRPWTGSVTAQGGTVSHLMFAVAGDSRPPLPNDTGGYPTAIVAGIFQSINSLSVKPQFVVTTGDHLFAFPWGHEGADQLDKYLAARSIFSGPLFPAMGNHECFMSTSANCGPGTGTASNNNYDSFVQKLLTPIGQTKPYYRVDVNHTGGEWTAKFLFIAANNWNADQQVWLTGQVAQPTTYTFIIRHEPASATTAPGVTPSQALIAAHPYTIAIVGHTHTYRREGPKEVIVGHGGAPLSSAVNYGYGLVQQLENGDIRVDNVDYTTGASVESFTVSP